RRSKALWSSKKPARSTSSTRSRRSARRRRPRANISTEDCAWSPRAACPAGNGSGSDKSDCRKRQADIPAFALARACAPIIHDKALATAHLGQGLLHRANAANFVGSKLVALPARLPLAVMELIDLSLVTALDRGGFKILRAFPRAHEPIGSNSRCRFDHGQDRMIARRRADDPRTRKADEEGPDCPPHAQA